MIRNIVFTPAAAIQHRHRTCTLTCKYMTSTLSHLSTSTHVPTIHNSKGVMTRNMSNYNRTNPNNIVLCSNKSSQCYYFSSMSTPMKEQNDDVLVIPSNLRFDPRATSTPIYGLDKIGTDIEDDYDSDDMEQEANELGQNVDDNDNDDVSDDTDIDNFVDIDEEDEDEDVLYSLTNKQEPTYVIPLPQRLNTPIFDLQSSDEVGTIHLSPFVFGNDPIRTDILHRCVVYQRNKKRGLRNNGARTKTISEVSGSGKKMRNQKGGGIARAGHKRPPHWRGGAKAHGPKGSQQNYETKLNKKVRMMGIRMALSQKLKEGNLILVNSLELETLKTKVLAKALVNLGNIGGRNGSSAYVIDHVPEEQEVEEDGTLRAVSGVDVNLKVASGNLYKVKVRNQKFVNVYDLLKFEKLVLSLSALEALEERYAEK